MNLPLLRLLFDFGLFVLIWMIQLLVYPSFKHYGKEQLLEWHKQYTSRITIIVIPLMFGQLVTTGIQVWQDPTWYSISSFIIVSLLWILTFVQFVPLHTKISSDEASPEVLESLVQRNWLRTFLWSLLLFMSLMVFLLQGARNI